MSNTSGFYSDLHELIISDYLRVEKSHIFYELMDEMENIPALASPNIFMMIRPRGFGLSLCSEALYSVLERTRDFTSSLRSEEVQEKADKLPRHHVLMLNLKKVVSRNTAEFREQLLHMLQQLYWEHHLHGAITNYTTPKRYFADLIEELSERHHEKIVVLIDNYDIPLIMASAMSEECRNECTAIYLEMLNVLKHSKERVQYAFLTGHIKFRLASMLSEGLPLIRDISSSDKYDTLFGFTHDELQSVFGKELEKVAIKHHLPKEAGITLIEKCYGNFSFSDRLIRVTCPVCVNHVISNDYHLYPYSSGGDYTFLRKALSQNDDTLSWLFDKDGQDPLFARAIDFIPSGKDLGSLLIQLGFATREKVTEHTLDFFSTWRYRFTCPNEDMRRTLEIVRGSQDQAYAMQEIDITQEMQSDPNDDLYGSV